MLERAYLFVRRIVIVVNGVAAQIHVAWLNMSFGREGGHVGNRSEVMKSCVTRR